MVIIPGDEIELRFVRASGPGGQHVNKVSTAVQLRWNIDRSRVLNEAARDRLKQLAGNRISAAGVLVLESSQFRSQIRNRDDAIRKAQDLCTKALRQPQNRKRTRPPTAANERRLDRKRRRAAVKADRRRQFDQ